ncbi:hypothetical protein HJC23_011250 [Cyclotella cryptica]|uniref:Uncharacterized protein n=1 Tax=Cyclotella cryptica TaxID=29204 RepID=A0ABD3QVR9_9STRA
MDEYQNDQVLDNGAGGLGLFGDDGDDDLDHQQLQQHQYEDDLDADDILGLDDDVDVMENPEGSLLMRFCPHDSSMLYPKVRLLAAGGCITVYHEMGTVVSEHGRPFHAKFMHSLRLFLSPPSTGKQSRTQTPLRMPPLQVY